MPSVRVLAGAGLGRERYRGGYCFRVVWQAIDAFPSNALRGSPKILARSTPEFPSWLTGSPGKLPGQAMIVRDRDPLYYKQAAATSTTAGHRGRRDGPQPGGST